MRIIISFEFFVFIFAPLPISFFLPISPQMSIRIYATYLYSYFLFVLVIKYLYIRCKIIRTRTSNPERNGKDQFRPSEFIIIEK